MTRREAKMIQTLVQCYRETRDDRLLDVIELLTKEESTNKALPLHFFNEEGACPALTNRMSYTPLSTTKEHAKDITAIEAPNRETIDSSGAVSYCDSDGQKDDEK